MGVCRCIYIVPPNYAQAIQVDEAQDVLVVSEQPDWDAYKHLRAASIHYVGNDKMIFDFARRIGALALRWQPLESLDVEVSGLNHIILKLALLHPLTVRCPDASFSEIHLAHGSELFTPLFARGIPLLVLKADKRTGRIPPLPQLYGATELNIDMPWDDQYQNTFDCRQLLPYTQLETLVLKGPISMALALTQLPIIELELHQMPDLSDFPQLNAFDHLEELTLCGCETESSQRLQTEAKNISKLLLYYMSTTDQAMWKNRGYIYERASKAIIGHSLDQSVLDIDPQAFHNETQELDAPSLFERMRTESVGDFFRNNSRKQLAAEAQARNQPSLFQRMRTESVTEFFRNNKNQDNTTPTQDNVEGSADQRSLLHRMRHDSVTDFFRGNKNDVQTQKDVPALEAEENDVEQRSLLDRMRHDSVTDFFRKRK